MISYILEVSVCWAVFYALYRLLLSRSTYFHFNRAYLLVTLLLSLLLPMAEWPAPQAVEASTLAMVYLQPISVGIETIEIVVTAGTEESTDMISLWDVLLGLYWLGVLFIASRFGYGLWKLYKLYRRSEKQDCDGYRLLVTDNLHTPFSFFHLLFWSRQMPYPPEDEKKIIRHEQAHMREWHSLDVLLMEVVSIIFWPSPLVYLYNRSLRVVHEYLADDAVLRHSRKKKQYGHLLLRQSQSGHQIALANHFFHSQLKKRILMMTKTKSKRHVLSRYLLAIPLALALALTFAFTGSDANPPSLAEILEQPEEVTTKGDVDRYPIFAGCGELESYGDQLECSNKKIAEFMMKNLKYPEAAKKAGLEGVVHVQFTVAKDGSVKDATVLKSAGKDFDAAALAVASAMPRWTPAMKDGEAVEMQMTLPFTFRLPKDPKAAQDEVFKVVEDMPRFPGCEDLADDSQERKKCADRKMLEFVYQNIEYPKDARAAGKEGVVVVSFIVNKEGRLDDISIKRSVYSSLDEEVKRVIGMMNEMEEPWTPGRQRGRIVKVEFLMPVKFVLPESETASDEAEEKLPDNTPHVIGYGVEENSSEKARQLQLRNYQASPNPTSGLLQLQFDADAKPLTLRILDSNGREVLREALNRFEGTYSESLDLSKLAKGAYILHISQEEKVFTDKVILQ